MRSNLLKFKHILNLLTIGVLFFFIISCEKEDDEIIKPKSYLDYSNFVQEGLIAYYPFNGNTDDYSGDNNGILNGAVPSADRFGDSVGSYYFDGIDDYIKIPNFPEMNHKRGTICFWSRIPDSVNDSSRAIISKIGTSGAGYVISVYGKGNYWFDQTDTNNTRFGETMYADYFSSDDFFFVGITFTESTLRLYFQGEQTMQSITEPYFLFNENDQPLYIARSLSLYPKYLSFKGEIDDVLIYNRELTEEEILQLYNWK